jgi:hypothetical protein
MSSSRTKCLSTKLTETEYATLERAAGAQTLSAWARAVLLRAAAPAPPVRVAGAYRGSPDRPDTPRADARGVDAGDGRSGPPTGDRVSSPADHRVALPADRPCYDPPHHVAWRPRSTDRWSWYPDRTRNGTLTRSPAWLPAMLVLACLSAGGIGAYRYAHVWTPLQRQYLWSYVWSAVAISRTGSYELLVIVDQATRRTALDADVVPVASTSDGDAFALTATPISRGAVRLAWQQSEWDHAELHTFLRQWVYQDQTLRDLAQPPLWGALAVLAAALVPVVSNEIALALVRRATRSAWRR